MAQNLQRLLNVASRFVNIVQTRTELQGIDGFSEAKMLLIGGLAVTSYTQHRATNEIDIVVSPHPLADAMKEVLKRLTTVFESDRGPIELRLGNEETVRIDIIPVGLLPYPPPGMQRIIDVNPNALPIADPLDLIAFAAYFCLFRTTREKRENDARDVYRLMNRYQCNDHLALMMQNQVDILRQAAPMLRQYGPGIPWGRKLP